MILEVSATFNFERFHGRQTKGLGRAGGLVAIFAFPGNWSRILHIQGVIAADSDPGLPLNKVIEKCTY